MDRRAFISSSAVALAVAPAVAQQAALRPMVLGVWSLTEAATVAGTAISPWFGRTNPVNGLLIYQANGWVSVQISGARPGAIARAEYDQLSDLDKFGWQKEYYGYYGRFEIDESSRTVMHHLVDSLLPYERQTTLKRRIDLEGDRLTLLTEPRVQAGQSTFNRLVWQRA
jgi:hypothetical protein